MARARIVAAAAACVLLAACDSPTEPSRFPRFLRLGDSVEGTVAGGDSIVYLLRVDAGELFTVTVEAREKPVAAVILDQSGEVIGAAEHLGAGPSGGLSYWTVVEAPSSDALRIIVTAGGSERGGGGFVLRASRVDPRPEHRPALVQLDDTVSGESTDEPTDIDDFEIDLEQGQEVNLFLQKLAPGGRTLVASLRHSSSDPFISGAGVSAQQATEDLEANASGRVTVDRTGRYRLRVQMTLFADTSTFTGAYRLQVRLVRRAPERAGGALTPGDTLASESIDHVGDVDEFTIAGTPGQEFNVFADAAGGLRQLEVNVETDGSYGTSRIAFAQPGDKLLDTPTGTFVIPSNGRATVTVADHNSRGGLFRGPYRLLLYPIDRAPEGSAQDIAPSRTPLRGTLDQYGDVDEYRLTLTSPQIIALRHNNTGTQSSLTMTWLDAAGAPDIVRTPVEPGTYRIRIGSDGLGTRSSYRGPYEFLVAAVDTAPEQVAPTLAVGGTVRDETLLWPEDIDRFRLSSATADTVLLRLVSSRRDDAIWSRLLTVTEMGTGQAVRAAPYPWERDTVQVPRIDIAAGTGYTVEISGTTEGGWMPGSGAPYELIVARVSAAPEHRGEAIAFADTVRDPLDYLGDIDDFVLRGTPGQEINVSMGWPVNFAPPALYVALIDPATGAKLAGVSTFSPTGYSPTVVIPAGGDVRIRVCVWENCQPPCESWGCHTDLAHALVTPWFVAHALDRAPEQVAPRFTVGDTVSGEEIHQPGDVDELTFDGASGQRVDVYFQYLTEGDFGIPIAGLELELVEVATGQSLGRLVSRSRTTRLEDVALRAVTLPRAGAYRVRVRCEVNPEYPSDRSWGEYRFRVANVQ